MSLKEATAEKHALAEGTKFMKAVFAKTLPMELWIDYTYQKSIWYKEIEVAAKEVGLLETLPGIERAELISKDYNEMTVSKMTFHTYRSVAVDYCCFHCSLRCHGCCCYHCPVLVRRRFVGVDVVHHRHYYYHRIHIGGSNYKVDLFDQWHIEA